MPVSFLLLSLKDRFLIYVLLIWLPAPSLTALAAGRLDTSKGFHSAALVVLVSIFLLVSTGICGTNPAADVLTSGGLNVLMDLVEPSPLVNVTSH